VRQVTTALPSAAAKLSRAHCSISVGPFGKHDPEAPSRELLVAGQSGSRSASGPPQITGEFVKPVTLRSGAVRDTDR
jgi:hypothetical protein